MSATRFQLEDIDDATGVRIEVEAGDNANALDVTIDGNAMLSLVFYKDTDGSIRANLTGVADHETEEWISAPEWGQPGLICRAPLVEREVKATDLRPGMRTRLTYPKTGSWAVNYRAEDRPGAEITQVVLRLDHVLVSIDGFQPSSPIKVYNHQEVRVFVPSWEETVSEPDPTVGSNDASGKGHA